MGKKKKSRKLKSKNRRRKRNDVVPIEETNDENVIPLRRITDPVNHMYWERAFSKALRMDKLNWKDDGRSDATMNISLDEQHNRVLKKRTFRLDVKFYNEETSSFEIYEVLEVE